MRTVVGGVGVARLEARALVGVVVARGCTIGPAPSGLDEELGRAIAAAKVRTDTEALTAPVRDLLRFGKYKPTGRGKPASEYLLRSAIEDRFPRINNLVDINNLISLRSLLPISLVDLELAKATEFAVRRGRAGESYVFNTGGQVIEVEDLLVVARLPEDEPCANPVKDSMLTKLNDRSSNVMAVLYAPPSLRAPLEAATAQFAEALRAWGGAHAVESSVP